MFDWFHKRWRKTEWLCTESGRDCEMYDFCNWMLREKGIHVGYAHVHSAEGPRSKFQLSAEEADVLIRELGRYV